MHETEAGSLELIGQIAGFTAQRDLDLLELSLLKSIYSIITPIRVSLLTLDHRNVVLKQVDYSAGARGVVRPEYQADNPLLSACDTLSQTRLEYCTLPLDDHSMSLFGIDESRRLSSYVRIESVGIGVSQSQAQQILGMLRIYRNFKQLLQEAQTDELTGLANRKAFDLICAKIQDSVRAGEDEATAQQRVRQQTERQWLSLIDIDRFKQVNDVHGHLMGDEVLVRVSQAMQTCVRENDMLFRYGGEEFAAITRCTDEVAAVQLMERLRGRIEAIEFPQVGRVTVSIGIAEMPPQVFTRSVIERADKALYWAKGEGRNQVCWYDDIAAELPQSESIAAPELF